MSNTCCGGLEEMKKRGFPFIQPMVVDMKAGRMTFRAWAIRLPRLTPSGNVSRKSGMNLFLNFCPFCGADIREKKDEKDKEVVEPPNEE